MKSRPMTGADAMMIDATRHIKGRFAFLKTEPKITAARTWVDGALRADARKGMRHEDPLHPQ